MHRRGLCQAPPDSWWRGPGHRLTHAACGAQARCSARAPFSSRARCGRRHALHGLRATRQTRSLGHLSTVRSRLPIYGRERVRHQSRAKYFQDKTSSYNLCMQGTSHPTTLSQRAKLWAAPGSALGRPGANWGVQDRSAYAPESPCGQAPQSLCAQCTLAAQHK